MISVLTFLKKKLIETSPKKSMVEIKKKYNSQFKPKRYGSKDYIPSSADIMKSWFPKKPIGVSVRSLVEKGQTIQELLAKTMAFSTDHQPKIIAWKFDEDFKGFRL